ncbi:MAG: hypothetical protein LBV09_08225 [Deferribacteraceae bacterium]|nr:hypothetical protein [Deferribacteraceae bacterium]
MFRKFPILLGIALFFSACADPVSNLAMVYNPITGIETGAWSMALMVEANSNFSSLLYDKTEADFESFSVRPFQVLPDNCSFYIMPAIYVDAHNNKTYDETYAKMMGAYLRFNSYGKVVQTVDEADYVVVIDVAESPEFFHGTNNSAIAVTIMDLNEVPVFFAKTTVSSRSDSNFYYRPSKLARPVKYLTLRGFERIFAEALPQAFS